MTPRESHSFDAHALAEKILGIVRNPDSIDKYQYEMAESLLAEAMDEAHERGRKSYGSTVSFERHVPIAGVAEAKAAAYEECAKIAEDIAHQEGVIYLQSDYKPSKINSDTATWISSMIRQRAKEIK